MREDNIKNSKVKNNIVKARKISILGFIIAALLLTLAISLAMNQERSERQAKLDESIKTNITTLTSGKIGKNINEVRNELEAEAKKKNDNEENKAADSSDKIETRSVKGDAKKVIQSSENGNKSEDKSTKGNEEKAKNKERESKQKSIANAEKSDAINTAYVSVSTSSKSENSSNSNSSKNTTENSDKVDFGKNENSSKKSAKSASDSQNVETGANSQNVKASLDSQNAKFIKPIDGDTVKVFSMDSLIYSETLQEWATHRGLDIKAEKNAGVKAISDGTIEAIKTDPRYGISVIIKHGKGFESVYACLLNATEGLKDGDEVKQGQVIGNIGNSGVFESAEGMHLHFELLKDGEYVNPDIYIK